MNKKHVKNPISDLQRRVEKLERKNTPAKPSDQQKAMEAAQDGYQEKLSTYQAIRQGEIIVSVNERRGKS